MDDIRGRAHAVAGEFAGGPLAQLIGVKRKDLVDLSNLAQLGHELGLLLLFLQRLGRHGVDDDHGHARRGIGAGAQEDIDYFFAGALAVADDDDAVIAKERRAGGLEELSLRDLGGFELGQLGPGTGGTALLGRGALDLQAGAFGEEFIVAEDEVYWRHARHSSLRLRRARRCPLA